jgi:tetratricopeptide (TPR) repeat protein
LSEGSARLTGALARPAEGPPTETYLTLRARALEWLGDFGIFQGERDAPQPRYEESLALYGELGNTEGIAEVLSHFGMLFVMRGNHERAIALLEESLDLYRELGNKSGIAWDLFFLGQPVYIQGHTRRAGTMFEESVALFREVDDTWGIASALFRMAMVALDEGAYPQVGTYLVESLIRLRELGERWQIVNTLEVLSCLAAVQGQQLEDMQPSLLRSARIFGATERLRETLSAPVLPSEQHFYERGVAILHAHLDAATLAAWAEGRAMTLEQAIEYALSEGVVG